jgi:hypothetical protein
MFWVQESLNATSDADPNEECLLNEALGEAVVTWKLTCACTHSPELAFSLSRARSPSRMCACVHASQCERNSVVWYLCENACACACTQTDTDTNADQVSRSGETLLRDIHLFLGHVNSAIKHQS